MPYILRHKKNIFLILSGSLLAVLLLYAYFLNQTIEHVVDRKSTEQEILALNSTLSDLEFQYIRRRTAISRDFAATLGFVEAKNIRFVARHVDQSVALRDDTHEEKAP